MTATLTRPSSYREAMRIDLPEIDQDGVRVSRFEVGKPDMWAKLAYLQGGGRGLTTPGTYTRLDVDGQLWMSDTDDEMRDHAEAYWEMSRRGGRVLIHGLGLGMVVKAALALPNVEHVDVVEIDPRVIAAVGPHYEGERCSIHLGDALTLDWPAGTRWSVVWHDIWPEITAGNLPTMHRLHRRFGRRSDWQGSWARYYCERGR
ncbi:spermidine synthase [Microbacterium phage MO526]|uniref:Spermidine synthase n=1 Tax=Microbacterium phage MO526 TaxID=3108092 RepID=A0ABZ0ZZV6_9CAUD|nr:spermidine synthase [Microbacterium phage MO526]